MLVASIYVLARFFSRPISWNAANFKNMVDQRYSGWESPEARAMLNGQMDLEKIAAMAEREMLNPTPRSGRQEQYENLIARSF